MGVPTAPIWVDCWGNEHEIEVMPLDYLGNVIGFCARQAPRIARIVSCELAARHLANHLGVLAPVEPADAAAVIAAVEAADYDETQLAWLRHEGGDPDQPHAVNPSPGHRVWRGRAWNRRGRPALFDSRPAVTTSGIREE
jgi:hypothetical protein